MHSLGCSQGEAKQRWKYIIGFLPPSSDHEGPCFQFLWQRQVVSCDLWVPVTTVTDTVVVQLCTATGFRVGLGEKKGAKRAILFTLCSSQECISLAPRLLLAFVLVHNSVTWPTPESKPGDKEIKNKIRKLITILVVLQVLTSLPSMSVIVYFQNPQLRFVFFAILSITFSCNQWERYVVMNLLFLAWCWKLNLLFLWVVMKYSK